MCPIQINKVLVFSCVAGITGADITPLNQNMIMLSSARFTVIA